MIATISGAAARFHWEWSSVKGDLTEDNRDAAGIFSNEIYTLAIILDAAPRGLNGSGFNKAWIKAILAALPRSKPSPVEMMRTMQTAQKGLRELGFREERACYAALVLTHHDETAYGLFCGDCRIGQLDPNNAITWLTMPHTGSSLCGNGPDAEHLVHIVTRTLNVRRFIEPEYVEIDAKRTGSWILSTDGHHCNRAADDRSTILLTRGSTTRASISIDNLYLLVKADAV